jgi:hypothetical protein
MMYKCKRCGYEWIPRTITPKECPSCKQRDWNGPTKIIDESLLNEQNRVCDENAFSRKD